MRTRLTLPLSLMAILALASGCTSTRSKAPAAAAPAPAPPAAAQARIACPTGQSRATTAELVFGRRIDDRTQVSDADWKSFIDEDVTPRFPDGLSVMDVQGQWRASNGQIVHEPSKVLYLVLDGGPDDPAKIANIRDAYKRRFRQESVLLVTRTACISF
jgi:hypothetical protein